MCLIVLGILANGFTAILSTVFIDDITKDLLILGYCTGLSLDISTVAIMYPILLKIGAEKSELVILVSGGLSFGILTLSSHILSSFKDGVQVSRSMIRITSAIISLILLFVSCFLSINIHKNKEF